MKRYSGTRAVILGASGFIGRWVARLLQSTGTKLFLFVRDPTTSNEIFRQYSITGDVVSCDLQRHDHLRNYFKDIRPSITFNLSGYGVDPAEREERSYRLNSEFIPALCSIVKETSDLHWPGQHLIHAGSALEYGDIGGDLSEDTSPNPTTLYGKSKLSGTMELSAFSTREKLRALTARLFTVYGPGEHNGRLLPSLLEAAGGKVIQLTAGTQKRDFTYVEDVAEGLIRLGICDAEPGMIVNLATGKLTSVRSFAETAADVLGISSGCLQFGVLGMRAEEMYHADVKLERLRHLTGWTPSMTVADGIRKTMNFLKSLKEI